MNTFWIAKKNKKLELGYLHWLCFLWLEYGLGTFIWLGREKNEKLIFFHAIIFEREKSQTLHIGLLWNSKPDIMDAGNEAYRCGGGLNDPTCQIISG